MKARLLFADEPWVVDSVFVRTNAIRRMEGRIKEDKEIKKEIDEITQTIKKELENKVKCIV